MNLDPMKKNPAQQVSETLREFMGLVDEVITAQSGSSLTSRSSEPKSSREDSRESRSSSMFRRF